MLELTSEQCKELESRIMAQLEKIYPEDTAGLVQTICKITVSVTIRTIREYERMMQQTEKLE